jgi:hypothetical protein
VFSYLNVLIHLLTDVSIIKSLMHHPGQSITNLYVWQPFTCLFVNPSLWGALWNGFCLWIHLYERDQDKGTTHTILTLGWISTDFTFTNNKNRFPLTGVYDCRLLYNELVWSLGASLVQQRVLASVYFLYIEKMLRSPGRDVNVTFLLQKFRFFCFPCPIKNKIYPFVFAVLSACIVGFRLDYFLCICLGYAASRLLMIQKVIDLKPETA